MSFQQTYATVYVANASGSTFTAGMAFSNVTITSPTAVMTAGESGITSTIAGFGQIPISYLGDIVQGGVTVGYLTQNGSNKFIVPLSGYNSAASATFVPDVSGNHDFNLQTNNPVCFAAGTKILTSTGEVDVETLKPGDLVTLADGRSAPVRWLGVQTIATRFADPMRAMPICIKAGALSGNIPSRDLRVSPGHALFIDGALIIASALVNGSSVVRETDAPETFKYYHIETDEHSLVLAENTPAETFVDNVDRMNFDNWAEHQAIYPEGRSVRELPYPVAKSHRQLPMKIRSMLEERAIAIGVATKAAA